jgi:hypothetical protein
MTSVVADTEEQNTYTSRSSFSICLARAGRGGVGVEDRGVARGGLEDQAGVADEADLAAAFDPALVDGDGCAVVAEAGGDIALAGGGSDDEAEHADAIGGDGVLAEAATCAVSLVDVEGAGGEEDESERDEELVLGLGFDLAFGVEGEVLTGGGVGSGERCLDVLGDAGGQDELAEVEVESAGAAEATGGFGLGDGSNHGGAFRNGDGVVGVVDGFGDGGFDLLAGLGSGGAERFAEVGLDDPGFVGSVCGCLGRLCPRGRSGRREGWRSCGEGDGLWRQGQGLGGFYGPGGFVLDALGVIGKLGVKKLDEAVALIGACNDGEFVAEDLKAVVPLLVNKATFAGRGGDQAEDRCAVGGGPGGDGYGGAVGESDAGEANDRDVEGSKVATEPRGDAAGVVGMECGDGAGDDGFSGKDESVVGVDGVDELGADGLADAHGEMIFDLDWEGRACGDRYRGALAWCGVRSKQKRQKQRESKLHQV